MTTNRRAKQDARDRQLLTGERYTAARRRTARSSVRLFRSDHCANCLTRLPQQVERLFCGELCRQTAEVVRYWRGAARDGRIEQPDVRLALRTRIAYLLAGGYPTQARRLAPAIRAEVHRRDEGRCRECGATGEEIDHIDGDSPALTNLQLLCKPCHQRKTDGRLVPATVDQRRQLLLLERERVAPAEPTMLCDDEAEWRNVELGLRKERRERLLAELADYGYSLRDFPSRHPWSKVWDEVFEMGEDEYSVRGVDLDNGSGADSFFAQAMATGG